MNDDNDDTYCDYFHRYYDYYWKRRPLIFFETLETSVVLILSLYLPFRGTGLLTGELSKLENEYIRNLQQQIYFLELEANYLYPYI